MNKFFILSFLISISIHINAADDIISLNRLSAPIVFDGKVDDAAWQSIEPLDVVMNVPDFKGEMTETTEIRIAYDDEFVYLSGINLDAEADKIMANTKKRDALSPSTDWFGIIIDSFNDKENACAFFTTPTGLRMDAQVVNDGLGRSPINISWNNFWDVRTTQDDKGWYVEMRIPFSSIPFNPTDDNITMGMTAWRYIARKGEVHVYPDVSPDFGEWSTWRPSLTQEFGLKDIHPKKPFYIIPYALTGLEHKNELNSAETSYLSESNFKKEIGLDIKYGINNNWNVDLSLNTDFAQVEVDDQQVNLTRFSLFFPEKRLFFQERSGVFNFNLDRTNQLFYSRRIGIDEDGDQQRILGGARIVGRAGGWDLGLINMQTHDNDVQNGENFTVLRAKSQIFNPTSDAGFLLTNRVGLDGSYNTAYGLDASINLFEQNFLYFRWAQTFDNDVEGENELFSLDPSFMKIWLSRRANRGFSYGISYSFAGKNFNPELGFQQRTNYQRFGNRTQYTFAPKNSKVFRHGFTSGGVAHWNKDSGKLESLFWRLGWSVFWNNNMNLSVAYRPRVENLVESFDLSDDVIIPVGDYSFNSVEVQFTSPSTIPFFVVSTFEKGDFYDGNINKMSLAPNWAINSSLELSATYEYNKANFDNRGQEFEVHLIGLRTLYMFSTKVSLAAFLQHNSLDKNYGGNIRFRYNPSEGNDLFIVYNDDLNIKRDRFDPILPVSNQRQILVKYSYTFRL